jgi:hypothetical protein
MSLGPGGFVILFLSTLLPFSGTFNLSVNQGLYTTLGMVSIAQHLKRDSILCIRMKSDKAYTYVLCDYVLGVILHSGEKQMV